MEFETLISRFRIIFNFFGLIQFNTYSNASQKRVSRFAAIVFSVILIATFLISIYLRHFYSHFSEIIFSIISYSQLFSELLLQLTIVAQALVFSKKLTRLRYLYDFIQKYMRTRIGYRAEFDGFQNRIYSVAALVLVPHLITLVLQKALLPFEMSSAFNMIHLAFYFVSALVKLHIAIQVELFICFLKLTTHWLRTCTDSFSASKLHGRSTQLEIQRLKGYMGILHMKLIHFKLWEISNSINQIFGWSVAAIILRNFIEMSYGAYWFYLFSYLQLQYTSLLRT